MLIIYIEEPVGTKICFHNCSKEYMCNWTNSVVYYNQNVGGFFKNIYTYLFIYVGVLSIGVTYNFYNSKAD